MTKHQGVKLLLNLFVLLCVGGFVISSANAQETQPAIPSATNTIVFDKPRANNEALHIENKIDNIQSALDSRKEWTDRELQELKGLIEGQRDIINDLKIDLKSITDKPITNGTTFEIWSGILLGCVAVLVTVLGVGVALLSFFGYRELIEKGTKRASLVAAKQTKIEVERFVAGGKLDTVIAEIINKIMYRGISSDSEEHETEDGDNE